MCVCVCVCVSGGGGGGGQDAGFSNAKVIFPIVGY